VFFVGLSQNGSPEGAEADRSSCDRYKPLRVEVKARCIKIRFDFFRGEDKIFIAFLDDKGSLFFSPEFPGHDLLFSIGVVVVGVGA